MINNTFHKYLKYTEPYGIIIAAISLTWTATQYLMETDDRKSNRLSQAWSLITESSPGSGGKGFAFQYLIEQGANLSFVDFSDDRNNGHVNLTNMKIKDTTLVNINFKNIVISNSVFKNIHFQNINAHGATFINTKFSNVSFSVSDLSDTTFINSEIIKTTGDVVNVTNMKVYDYRAKIHPDINFSAGLNCIGFKKPMLFFSDKKENQISNKTIMLPKSLDIVLIEMDCTNKENTDFYNIFQHQQQE